LTGGHGRDIWLKGWKGAFAAVDDWDLPLNLARLAANADLAENICFQLFDKVSRFCGFYARHLDNMCSRLAGLSVAQHGFDMAQQQSRSDVLRVPNARISRHPFIYIPVF
jgi:hypothetical protein